MRALTGLLFIIFAPYQTALAGAWVASKNQGKLIINHIEQKQDPANVMHFRHKEVNQSLLVEYGLNGTFGIAAKRGRQENTLPQGTNRFNETRFGIMLNAPRMATGLLPPYLYRAVRSFIPVNHIKREKRASLTFGWYDDGNQYWSALAQGDRVSIGPFRMTQEVEFDRVRGKGRDWRNWLYRFTLGFDAVDIGTEAHHFIDYRGTYQALSHSYYLQWRANSPALKNWQMRLKSGTRRAPLGRLGVQKNQTLTIEFERAF